MLRIPDKSQRHEEVFAQLQILIEQDTTLLLPMATILETGNHVAQNGNGGQRRKAAERFVEQVQKAIRHQAPFSVPEPLFDPFTLDEYLDQFPHFAMQGLGLGDLSIVREFYHQCELHRGDHVFIWTYDEHLAGYVQEPPDWAR